MLTVDFKIWAKSLKIIRRQIKIWCVISLRSVCLWTQNIFELLDDSRAEGVKSSSDEVLCSNILQNLNPLHKKVENPIALHFKALKDFIKASFFHNFSVGWLKIAILSLLF